jgi:hypothetical protein
VETTEAEVRAVTAALAASEVMLGLAEHRVRAVRSLRA